MNTKALQKISYGMYVIGSKSGERLNGQIANTVIQTTSEPPNIAICINKQNLTHEFIEVSGVFSASVLSEETPMPFIGHFGFKSGRDLDKFEGVNYRAGETGVPIVLDNATAFIEAEVVGAMDAVSHTMFLGRVIDCDLLAEGKPMTYAFYHEVKRGKSPKAAPTYIKE
ncbi:MAG: flavin reductase [Actinobacteria bacterium]|nr:flavin reductase [Actinomycetota bacterium]